MAAYTNDSDYNNGLGVSSLYFLGDTTNFLTTDGVQTITGKTIDFNQNTILNAGSGGGSGGSGDTIAPTTHGANLIPKWGAANSKTLVAGVVAPSGALVGTFDNQTLTNKSIDYNLNTIVNLPVYNDTTLVSGISNLNLRTSNLEITITTFDPRIDALEAADITLDNRIDTNTDDITALDLRLDAVEPELIVLDGRIDAIDPQLTTLSNNIFDNTSNITALQTRNTDYIEPQINNFVFQLDSINTTLGTIDQDIDTANQNSTNAYNLAVAASIENASQGIAILNRAIAPFLTSNNYIPIWGETNRTLLNGVVAPSSALVGVSDNQTLVSKTIDYNLNTILNLPSSGPAPNASNVMTINSNLNVDITNITNNYKFKAFVSTQSIAPATATTFATLVFDSEVFDTNNNFNPATYKYTVPVSGYYKTEIIFAATHSSTSGTPILAFFKNSVEQIQYSINPTQQYNTLTDLVLLTAGDIINYGFTSFATVSVLNKTVWSMNLQSASAPTALPIITTVNYNAYTYDAGSGNVMTGQVNSNNYIPVWSSNNSTYLNNGISLTELTAYKLKSATTVIDISASAAPSSNMVLKATSASNAIWDNHYKIFNPYRLNVYTNTGTIAVQPSGDTKISTFDNVFLDPMSGWNNTTKRYIIPITGYYRCFANITYTGYTINLRHSVFIKLGTAQIARTETSAPGTTGHYFTMQAESVFNAVAGDYIEIWSYFPSGSTKVYNDSATKFYSYFTMEYLGSA